MPELPEVERGRRIAERALLDRRITRVMTADDRIVYAGVTPRRFAAALRDRQVRAVHRRGKYLWLELDQRPWPAFHFGMTGSFRVYRHERDRPLYTKCELLVDDGTRLAMPNPRRLDRIRLLHDPQSEPPICHLGFDPLLDLPTLAVFLQSLVRRKAPVKAVLLDQSFAAGIGNWIADEVLYQARIAPHRRACDLSADEVRRVRTRLAAIVRRAVAVDADKRRFPRTWLFHRRWGRKADAVTATGNHPITHDTIGGRTTAWVPAVQR